MGLFCANIHVLSDDADLVREACGEQDVEVLAAGNGWVSVYSAGLTEQGADSIEPLAGAISQRLGTRAVSFWVYDSDIACYWLHDSGDLVDHHNSWPDYFDDGSFSEGRGNEEVLAAFCGPDTSPEDLHRILHRDSVCADDIVTDIAGALGIDPQRALMDHRDLGEHATPERPAFPSGDGWENLESTILGGTQSRDDYPAEAISLVSAAADGDEAAVRRLIAEGRTVDEPAPTPLPGNESLAGLGMVIPGGRIPEIVVTPLLAAVMHNREAAVTALLELGADPNQTHDICGTPVHAAAAAGYPQLVRFILDAGGHPEPRNRQGQTPLQVLAASRQQLAALEEASALMKTMGMGVPDVIEQLATTELPSEGWDACEQILRDYGAG